MFSKLDSKDTYAARRPVNEHAVARLDFPFRDQTLVDGLGCQCHAGCGRKGKRWRLVREGDEWGKRVFGKHAAA